MKLMVASLKRHLRIWKVNLYQTLMHRMEYRFNFFLMLFSVSLQVGLYLVFIGVIFRFVDNLAGWNYEATLLIVASYMIIEGLMWALVAQLWGIGYKIRTGDLDILLTKPMNNQFLVSIYRGDPEDWSRVLIGMIVIGYSFSYFDLSLGEFFINGLLYFYFIANAVVIVYSLTLMARTFSFWFVEGHGLWMFLDSLLGMGGYPIDIYQHKIVRFVLTFIIPVAFIGTIPAKVFRGDFIWIFFFVAPVLAAIFFILSKKFWEYGLSRYSSASS